MIYDWKNPMQALEDIKEVSMEAVKKEESWYSSFRSWHSFFSRGIRVLSLLLFSVGLIIPMLPLGLLSNDTKLGYLSLAIGGFFLLLDRYLGVSSGYVRFYVAELDIKKSTAEFQDNWNIEIAKTQAGISVVQITILLEMIKTFRASVFNTVQAETALWANEFQTQTSELYEMFRKKQEESLSALGTISVMVENYAGYTGIKLMMDDSVTISIIGSYLGVFRNVDPGVHKITIEATKQAGKISFSQNVSLSASKTADVVMKLP
ncbi:SLATT domain-containing protein [Pedobacter alluvionis]|uniref:SLATT domain-containing protein n=1 Tax=Pedobacter alluvionis TaxID=475253 RepID=A0A497XVK9_9SPHI|nr:SLATT domain-containing protein [Pedobacter alluvionis]RLJ73674.1 hypothetical protein BCL90_3836 [Pedobacter alluvionis]TFB32703.1 SLATT domain-containing protein [Pedobacter alluvionis]